jgi:hypothetical protein
MARLVICLLCLLVIAGCAKEYSYEEEMHSTQPG